MTNILWVTGRYQLGDDPGLFQDAIYVGHALELPFRKTWIDPNTTSVKLIIYTNDVETWGAWQGHKVSINDVEIGRIKDPNDTQGVSERFEFTIARSTFDKALAGNDDFLLTVELETQASQPGLSDDFIIHRIESGEMIAAKLGWK